MTRDDEIEFSDEELMVLFKRGNAWAFEKLYRRHGRPLFVFLCRMCRDRSLAEEMHQEAWVKVARAASDYEPRGRFRGWLYRIAANHCLNVLQSAEQRSRGQLIFLDAARQSAPPAASAGPARLAEARDERRRVLDALDRLAPAYRAALLMREMQDMSIEEIARVLEKPAGTIKTLLHRGRRQLRLYLEQPGQGAAAEEQA